MIRGAASVGRWPLHGGADLAASPPVLLAVVAVWLVDGGCRSRLYGRRTYDR